MVVSLKGIARDNEGLSAFVAKLQTIPGCERVEMQEVSRQGEGESQGMSFSLECRIRESGR
jgi:Tfp pilus assembly protein PilN